MEFANQMRDTAESDVCVRLQQVLGLVFEVIEIWIGGKRAYRHGELPFVGPEVRIDGQKVSS